MKLLIRGTLDIDSHFVNIAFEETIEICINELFKKSNMVHGLKKKKSEFNDLLSLATKGSYFVFNNIFYKQIVRSAIANAGLL